MRKQMRSLVFGFAKPLIWKYLVGRLLFLKWFFKQGDLCCVARIWSRVRAVKRIRCVVDFYI